MAAQQSTYIRAREATYLKSRVLHSAELSDAEKVKINVGDVVEATIKSMAGNYWVLDGAKLNGVPVPSHVDMALKGHWTKISPPASAAAEADASASTEKIRKLLHEGKSVSAIAKELRIGRSKVKAVRDEMGGTVVR
jgi:DNA-binding NarL/FixJ family response regulator